MNETIKSPTAPKRNTEANNPRRDFFRERLFHSFNGEILEKAIDRVIENQDRYYALLRSTGQKGIEDLISAIDNSRFSTGHSHSHHHYPTGLLEHSLGVYDQMILRSKGSGQDQKDIILVGLLHDICMAHNAAWASIPGGHGSKSANIVKKYLPNVSNEVVLAINLHRHSPHGDDVQNHPLWALVRKSDIADSATSPGNTLKFMELSLGHKEEVMNLHFNREKIKGLLLSTQRDGIKGITQWLRDNNFFYAPASVHHHNAFRGGLAKHSLDVYNIAMELNKTAQLPEDSVTICALLHDICKYDQYFIDKFGKLRSNRNAIAKGHGLRSVRIITRDFRFTLSHDEQMAIWWHMGQYEKSKEKYPKEYEEAKNNPLVQLINRADGIAAKVKE